MQMAAEPANGAVSVALPPQFVTSRQQDPPVLARHRGNDVRSYARVSGFNK